MNLLVKINDIEKTDLIDWSNFEIEDNINEQPNMLDFVIKVFEGQDYKPEINDHVVVHDGEIKIFDGRIIRIKNTSDSGVVSYEIEAKDRTLDLDRILVVESFKNKTIREIIVYIVDNYLTGVTYNNVNCDIATETISFNKLSASKSIDELALLVNGCWYIDYDGDIHFFMKNDEPAPFNIGDGSVDYIQDSLVIDNDLSQLRNAVTIEGGEIASDNTRIKTHSGDGTEKSFATDYKFSELPIVRVGGVTKTVGVDNIDKDEDYDCFWNYEQKYVRFIIAPALDSVIELESKYLYPIIVSVEENGSIGNYGRYEFNKVDLTIKSVEEAKQYAEAQLNSYATTVREGSFRTYNSGLSSGQTISINLTNRGISENFLIQRVRLEMISANEGEWTVELATLRTISLITFLQSLLISEKKKLEIDSNAVLKKYYLDYQTVRVSEEIRVVTKQEDFKTIQVDEDIIDNPFGAVMPDFVLGDYVPTGHDDPKREFYLDASYLG